MYNYTKTIPILYISSNFSLLKPLFTTYEKEKIQIEILAKKLPDEKVVETSSENKPDGGQPVIYDGDILDRILKVFRKDEYQNAVNIMNCESTGNRYAYNDEEFAKSMGWTEFSSCGLFQINSELCTENNSILYNPFVNIDEAFKKFSVHYKWSDDWKVCAKKFNLL